MGKVRASKNAKQMGCRKQLTEGFAKGVASLPGDFNTCWITGLVPHSAMQLPSSTCVYTPDLASSPSQLRVFAATAGLISVTIQKSRALWLNSVRADCSGAGAIPQHETRNANTGTQNMHGTDLKKNFKKKEKRKNVDRFFDPPSAFSTLSTHTHTYTPSQTRASREGAFAVQQCARLP